MLRPTGDIIVKRITIVSNCFLTAIGMPSCVTACGKYKMIYAYFVAFFFLNIYLKRRFSTQNETRHRRTTRSGDDDEKNDRPLRRRTRDRGLGRGFPRDVPPSSPRPLPFPLESSAGWTRRSGLKIRSRYDGRATSHLTIIIIKLVESDARRRRERAVA